MPLQEGECGDCGAGVFRKYHLDFCPKYSKEEAFMVEFNDAIDKLHNENERKDEHNS
jgi:hypothetical protein